MSDAQKGFDSMAFYDALDATRIARKLNWKQVGAATSVSASTLTRMAQGKRPDADSLAALAAWAGINPADYVHMAGKAEHPEPLAMITTYLRSDPNLTPEGATALDELIKAAYKRFAISDQ